MSKARTSETHPLRVDFIASESMPLLNNLGMTFAPGKTQLEAMTGRWRRDLRTDIAYLKAHYGATTLVSLVEEYELRELAIEDLVAECDAAGLEILRFPIRDVSVPASAEAFGELVDGIAKRLRDGGRIVVHCKGGLGRAGLTTACAIVAASEGKIDGAAAIELVRAARNGTIETEAQEEFVKAFRPAG